MSSVLLAGLFQVAGTGVGGDVGEGEGKGVHGSKVRAEVHADAWGALPMVGGGA